MLQILKMKSEIIKRWIIVILASAIIGISVSLFILSFEIYNDGYGTDISFNMDMIIFFICGVAILVYGIYSIYAYKNICLCFLPIMLPLVSLQFYLPFIP